jgi:hypothetical protein
MALERVQSLTHTRLDEAEAIPLLAAMPRFRGLDREAGWFSIAGRTSRLAVALRRIFAVADSVPLPELQRALSKQGPFVSVASRSRPALQTYLRDVLGCAIAGDEVRAGAGLAPARLGGSDRAIVDVLLEHGGEMPRAKVRAHAERLGITLANLRRLVRESPVVVAAAGGRLRLVGTPRPELLPPAPAPAPSYGVGGRARIDGLA